MKRDLHPAAPVRPARFVPPLVTAAMDAWDEVESLRLELNLACDLQDGEIGYKQARDASEAYVRSYDRAVLIQKLADEDQGQYNVWEEKAS